MTQPYPEEEIKKLICIRKLRPCLITNHVQIRVEVGLHVDEMVLRSTREKEVKDFGLRALSILSDLLAVVPAMIVASSIANLKRVNRVRREGLPSTFQAEGGAFTVGSEDALFR